jgi:hypothetical protein
MIVPLFTFDEGLLNGSDFSQASWVKTNITLTINATTAPDGTVTADKLLATASVATSVAQTVNGAGKASGKQFVIFAKQGSAATDGNKFTLRNVTTATNLLDCTVNFGTGVVTMVTGPAANVTMFAYPGGGGGWWRIVLDSTGLALSDGDNLQVFTGFNGAVETLNEFVFVWSGSLRSVLEPTYPAFQKPMAPQQNVVRHDSITSSGIKQSVVERREKFLPLNWPFVPQADIAEWTTFMNWALDGQVFTYYPDSTDPTTHTDYSLEDTNWLPKRAAFGHGTHSINMRVWV